MLVLGTDPGIAALGFGLIHWAPNAIVLVQVGTVRTDPKLTLQQRLAKHYAVLSRLDFDVGGIEDQERAWAAAQAQGLTNAKAVLVRVVEGLVRTLAVAKSRPLLDVSPQQLRSALGLAANASKEQCRTMVRRRVRGLPETMSEHAADGLAVAVATGARWSVESRIAEQRRHTQ